MNGTTTLSTTPHHCFHSNTPTSFLNTVSPIQFLSFRNHTHNLRVLCFSSNPSQPPPVVVVGSANADIYVEIDRLPREGETLAAKSGQTLAGGKGANQATCSAKLSYPTYFVGQVGNDAYGSLLADALRGGGVRLDNLAVVASAPTGHAVVMLQSNGQNSIIIIGGSNMSGWPSTLPRQHLDLVAQAGIVLLQREIPDAVNVQVAQAARNAGVPVVLDAGGMDGPLPPQLLNFVDILSPNETELARLTGMPTESFEEIAQAALKCHELGVKQVLVKLGEKGSALFVEGEKPIQQPAILAKTVVDTTGAGDTFTAAFAVALVEGKSKKECLRFAAAAACLCVQVKGASPSMPDRKSEIQISEDFETHLEQEQNNLWQRERPWKMAASKAKALLQSISARRILQHNSLLSFIGTTLLSTPPHYCFHSNTQTTFLSTVTPIQNLSIRNNNFRVLCFSSDPSQLPPVVVVGSANADIYVEVDRLPGEGETLAARSGQTIAGGKGANQATCSAKLAYPTYFVGQVGDDAYGRLVTAGLRGGGVRLDNLAVVASAATGHAVVMLQSNGQNSIVYIGGANLSCWPSSLPRQHLDLVAQAGIVLLQREIPDAVNAQVAQAAKNAGVPVVLDAGGMDGPLPPQLINFVDILSPNETELARLTGMPTESFEEIQQAALKCHEMGAKQVLVKLGHKGSALFVEGEKTIQQPAILAKTVVDTTGAGDTFTAAFAVALVEGKSKKECLRFAAAAACLCVQVKGASPSMPDRKSVLDLLNCQ
ncbi:Ribokinase [Glycine soja]